MDEESSPWGMEEMQYILTFSYILIIFISYDVNVLRCGHSQHALGTWLKIVLNPIDFQRAKTAIVCFIFTRSHFLVPFLYGRRCTSCITCWTQLFTQYIHAVDDVYTINLLQDVDAVKHEYNDVCMMCRSCTCLITGSTQFSNMIWERSTGRLHNVYTICTSYYRVNKNLHKSVQDLHTHAVHKPVPALRDGTWPTQPATPEVICCQKFEKKLWTSCQF